MSRLHGHVIVCGMQGLAVRIVELLRSAGISVVVVGNDAADHHLRRLQAFDVPCIAGSPRNPQHLWEAGLAEALAVVCAEDDDLRSLEVALLVQELVPDKRVIVRQSNPAVGRAVTSVLTHSLVVNPADLAGPTFVESVLDERLHRMRIADDEYVVRELQVTRSGRLEELFGELAPILVTHGDGAQVICPSRDCTVQAGDLVALVGTQGELVDVADVPAKPLGTPVRAV